MRTPETGNHPDGVREGVEWYFGDLLDEVASSRPVSRARLLTALVSVHLAASRRRPADEWTVTYRGATETVVAIPDDEWPAPPEVSGAERRATETVHRRMAVALGAAGGPDRTPLVLPD